MAATKKPPTFQFLPKTRAKRLKKSWVEDHKIRRKWRAQMKREGLTRAPVEDISSHPQNEAGGDSSSDPSPAHPEKSPGPTPPQDKQSLRNLRRIAYASSQTRKEKAACLRRDGKNALGQPNMKLRMNVLLEKIKRDLS